MYRINIVNNVIIESRRVLESIDSRILPLIRCTKIRSIKTNESCQICVLTHCDDKIYSKNSMPAPNVSKFVSPLCANITPFSTGKHNFLRQKNGILSVVPLVSNRQNIRQFSNSSTEIDAIPTLVKTEGIWKTLSESAPVEFMQNGLVWLHTSSGLPWWATIIIATWTLRAVVTLPLAVYQSTIMAKYHNHTDEMNVIVENLKLETNYAVHKFKWTEEYARAIYNRSLKKQRQKLIERDNCHPMKSFILVLVQVPMWITVSTALRNLCYVMPYNTESARMIYFELTTGGFGWVTNLTVSDPYYAIPVALGLLNLAILELQTMMKITEPNKSQRYVLNFIRLMCLAMIPLASYVPTAMSLYWASSSAFGIVQNFCLMSPSFRRLTRIPPTDTEIYEPYSHLYTNFRRRIGIKGEFSSIEEKKKLSNT